MKDLKTELQVNLLTRLSQGRCTPLEAYNLTDIAGTMLTHHKLIEVLKVFVNPNYDCRIAPESKQPFSWAYKEDEIGRVITPYKELAQLLALYVVEHK